MSSTELSVVEIKRNYTAQMPKKWLYSLAIAVGRPFIKLFTNYRIIRRSMEDIEGPVVVLANHCSVFDWLYVPLAMYPRQLSIVVSNYFFSHPKLTGLLTAIGTIPKDQFVPDVRSVKNILSIAKKGGNIALFPEGRMSCAGGSEFFSHSTVKLLRHIGKPVVGVHLCGAHMTIPKWSGKPRHGRVDVVVEPLFSCDELKNLSDDEIFDRMVEHLHTDEYAWQKENHVRFSGAANAEGLQGVCYYCPKCGSELDMKAEKNKIYCEKCGNGATLNSYYELTPLDESCVIPENTMVWLDMERELEHRRALEDENYSLSGKVAFLRTGASPSWFTEAGEGHCTIDKNGFCYRGTSFGEEVEIFFPLAALPTCAHSPNKSLELHRDSVIYRFVPENSIVAQRWMLAIEQLHNVHCGEEK